MHRRTFSASLAALAAGGMVGPAFGQQWPQKPVRIILSQPPGNGVDAIARLLAEKLGRAWQQPVIVDNKPGGQNTIGAQAAARAAPDGYTFYFATLAALVTNRYLFKQLPYDTDRDFTPVGFVGRSPFSLVVPASSPLMSLQQLIAKAKAEPGKVSMGIEGPRSFGGMVARLFAARAGISLNLVSYASGSVAMQDAMGAQIDVLASDLASVAPLVRQGKLRLLATTTAERVKGWEQTPTVSELLPDFDMVGWFAMVAPTGTPAAVIERFNSALNAALQEPSVAEHIGSIGPVVTAGLTPAQTGALIDAESKRWKALTAEIGVLPE